MSSCSMPDGGLPAPLASLVDGTDLARKVGHTISLVAVGDDGWPRLALLSAGEVLSTSGSDLRLAMYGGSGTTAALSGSGKALLNVVLDGTSYKIRAEVARVATAGDARFAYFSGRIVQVDEDRVSYAEITSGIMFQLADPESVTERWAQQIEHLRRVAP